MRLIKCETGETQLVVLFRVFISNGISWIGLKDESFCTCLFASGNHEIEARIFYFFPYNHHRFLVFGSCCRDKGASVSGKDKRRHDKAGRIMILHIL